MNVSLFPSMVTYPEWLGFLLFLAILLGLGLTGKLEAVQQSFFWAG